MLVWSDGEFPIMVPEWYPPKVGQYMFDPQSFMNILHGVILHLLIGRIIPFSIGLPLALLIELGWEFLENTEYWRKLTNNDEDKESIHHVVGAIISCLIGYSFSTMFLSIGAWWLSIAWIVISEIGCFVYMRDNLTLSIIMVIYPMDRIKQWQQEVIPKEE